MDIIAWNERQRETKKKRNKGLVITTFDVRFAPYLLNEYSVGLSVYVKLLFD